MKYIIFSVSIVFISWLVGMILNAIIKNTSFYASISNLNFIKNSKLNKVIGLNYFKWIVKNTFFKFFNQKIKVDNKQTDLKVIRKEMTIAEVSHLIAFVFVFLVAVYKSVTVSILLGLSIMLVNVLMNLYPSLLQQENKRRLDKFVALKNRKANK